MDEHSPVLFDNIQAKDESPKSKESNVSISISEESLRKEKKFEDENILAEFLRFRNAIAESTEELKSRRSSEKKNEERIDSLLAEKHEAERRLESEKCRAMARESEFDAEILYNKRLIEEKVKDLENEKNKYNLSFDCGANENKLMKEEIRNLQLDKYSFEKQVNGLQRSLQLQTSLKDACIKQIDDLESKSKALEKRVHEIDEGYKAIENSVKEAAEINAKLSDSNEQYETTIGEQESRVKKTTEEIIRLKVELVKEYQKLKEMDESKKNEIDRLQTRLGEKDEMSKRLLVELKAMQDEREAFLSVIADCQNTLSVQIASHAKVRENVTELEESLATTKESLSFFKVEVSSLERKLKDSERSKNQILEEGREKERNQQEEINDLKEKVASVEKDYANNRLIWEVRETTYKIELQTLKEKVEKECTDEWSQTVSEKKDGSAQTDQSEKVQLQFGEPETSKDMNGGSGDNAELRIQQSEKTYGLHESTDSESLNKVVSSVQANVASSTAMPTRTLPSHVRMDRGDHLMRNTDMNRSPMQTACLADSTMDTMVKNSSELAPTCETMIKQDQSTLGSVVNWVVGKFSSKKEGTEVQSLPVQDTIDEFAPKMTGENGRAEKKTETKEQTPLNEDHILSEYQKLMKRIEMSRKTATFTEKRQFLASETSNPDGRERKSSMIGDDLATAVKCTKRVNESTECCPKPSSDDYIIEFGDKNLLGQGSKKARLSE